MKYTNYIYGDRFINIDSLQTDNKYFKHSVIIAKIPVAFLGVCVVLGLTPMTLMVDEYRDIKSQFIRKYRKSKKS